MRPPGSRGGLHEARRARAQRETQQDPGDEAEAVAGLDRVGDVEVQPELDGHDPSANHRMPRPAATHQATTIAHAGSAASRAGRLPSCLQVPSNSPIGLRWSTRSQTALIAIRIGMPSSMPQTPHSQPQASTPMNTATAFMRLALLVTQGTSR